MKRINLFFLLGLLPFFQSCKENKEFTYTSTSSLKEIFEISDKENKGVILLLGSEGCGICDGLLSDINNDKKFKEKVSGDYILARINRNNKDILWVYQLLERDGSPVFLFFDKSRNMKGYIGGYKGKEEFGLALNRLKESQQYVVSDHIMESLSYPVSEKDLLDAFGNVFKSQLLIISDEQSNFPEIEKLLIQSIDTYPSIYAQYLLASLYQRKGDEAKSTQYAQHALNLCNIHRDRVVYISLRENLYRLLNKNYNYTDEAFFEEEKDKSMVGVVEYGKENKIIIPFINGGKKELKLIKVQGDCSCTNVTYSDTIINPGGRGEIHVSLKPEEKGNFKRTLMIISNGINSPHFIYMTGFAK